MAGVRTESVSKASGAARKPAAAETEAPPSVSTESREHMIAMAAYYIAEHRGFQGGDPQSDWLQAEAEIDSMLGSTVH